MGNLLSYIAPLDYIVSIFNTEVIVLSGNRVMKKIDTDNIKHLLIRSASRIGDAALTTPAVRAIRKNFPNAQISLLAKPWVSPIFENSPHVDEIILFDGKGRHKGLGRMRLSKELKPHGFDAAVLLESAVDAAVITLLAGIPVRIGYKKEARTLLLTHPVPFDPETSRMHKIHHYQRILTGAGLRLDGDELDLYVGEKDRRKAESTLRAHRVTPADRVIGVNPGATFGNAKCWFPERFAQLSKKLQEKYNATIIVFGAPGEEALGKEIARVVGKDCINLCGNTTLGEVFALIERCDAFFSNDSGLMNIAAALAVPQIAIFGSTNHVTTSPLSPTGYVLRVPMSCSPCFKTDCPKEHHNCMKAISVDMVLDMAEIVIAKHCNW